MELFLNTVWLLLALATLAFWACQRPAQRNERSLGQGLIVLGCVLTLLFPVISMTDDLHAQQVAMEDASATTKKLVKAGERAKALLNERQLPAVLLLPSPENALWHILGRVTPAAFPVTIAVPAPHTSGCSPPWFA
jgi:hypothetical protein